jgi:hypothetical protein
MTNWALLGLIFFTANLPWFSDKPFDSINLNRSNDSGYSKNIAWCLLELLILYFLTGTFIWYAERATFGQVAPQGWEFYAVTGCLYLVFAFPGFVYKVLWKRTI